jgi:hypothetical protein
VAPGAWSRCDPTCRPDTSGDAGHRPYSTARSARECRAIAHQCAASRKCHSGCAGDRLRDGRPCRSVGDGAQEWQIAHRSVRGVAP